MLEAAPRRCFRVGRKKQEDTNALMADVSDAGPPDAPRFTHAVGLKISRAVSGRRAAVTRSRRRRRGRNSPVPTLTFPNVSCNRRSAILELATLDLNDPDVGSMLSDPGAAQRHQHQDPSSCAPSSERTRRSRRRYKILNFRASCPNPFLFSSPLS
ncbi:hypothetical protein EYF80_029538 [Liparis tanakae]|uniref:Uncharacterized protein n=1 Tax=Liparis tanakae TaxID=230148 RepID=A0A4Z2H546_9TELE|nr:hypothetical protein EYF80_029538 [Liparis tanakae]